MELLKIKKNKKDLMDSDNLYYIVGLNCYNQKQYSNAISFFEEAIKSGNSNAITQLGVMYVNSLGVERNYNKAKKLFEEAIKLNNSSAMVNLGFLYMNGIGVETNYNKAKELYEEAIKLNNNSANVNLGYMYQRGLGIERDYNKAKELYEKSIKLNNVTGMLNLAYMYELGEGMAKNYEKAIELYFRSYKISKDKTYIKRIRDILDDNMLELLLTENVELKYKIKELETQIKYQPEGEGYLEAKENFEILIKQQ